MWKSVLFFVSVRKFWIFTTEPYCIKTKVMLILICAPNFMSSRTSLAPQQQFTVSWQNIKSAVPPRPHHLTNFSSRRAPECTDRIWSWSDKSCPGGVSYSKSSEMAKNMSEFDINLKMADFLLGLRYESNRLFCKSAYQLFVHLGKTYCGGWI